MSIHLQCEFPLVKIMEIAHCCRVIVLIVSYVLPMVYSQDCNPTQVHIVGSIDASTSMTISYLTKSSKCASTVFYGVTKDDLSMEYTTKDDSFSYTSNTTKFGPYTSDYIHHVTLNNLIPDTNYFYKIANSTKTYDFVLPPPTTINYSDFPLKFALVGDLGQTNNSRLTVAHITENNPHEFAAILHAGDMSYADAEQPRWDSYFEMIEAVAATTPWYVSAGNHEIEINDQTYEVFTAYQSRYKMPNLVPASIQNASPDQFTGNPTPSVFQGHYENGNSYYKTEIGPATIIFLNSYTDTNLDSPQYIWLENTLASVDRVITPWLFVLFHCPFYNSFNDHQNEIQEVTMMNSMENLFINNRVNAIFSGHVHGYERTKQVAYGELDDTAPMYVIIGDGGNREGHADKFLSDTPPVWSAYRNGEVFGLGSLTINSKNSATWSWIKNVNETSLFASGDTVELENSYFL